MPNPNPNPNPNRQVIHGLDDADATAQECVHGLRQMYQRDLQRDHAVGRLSGVQIAFPFLDDELVQVGS